MSASRSGVMGSRALGEGDRGRVGTEKQDQTSSPLPILVWYASHCDFLDVFINRINRDGYHLLPRSHLSYFLEAKESTGEVRFGVSSDGSSAATFVGGGGINRDGAKA